MRQELTIVAFRDNAPRAVKFKRFRIGGKTKQTHQVEAAIGFYRAALLSEDVKVISTRKTRWSL